MREGRKVLGHRCREHDRTIERIEGFAKVMHRLEHIAIFHQRDRGMLKDTTPPLGVGGRRRERIIFLIPNRRAAQAHRGTWPRGIRRAAPTG